ncbi:hypothetical protein N7448_006428 [Penicillium atrosanguineum]|uniref:Uncharacterized protein n=1 Tax=Penicillium atrosanguineum TaxID=1132637 RepID=A0A9W9U215_9EURO|nr:uncharacterized protein N7443_010188 [Penicillium atrosanguineum]KAJ5132270.1 hypothetical protein N7448_006428 [Penicillium atrosanguineum]KAJ5289935.1 hypothetical protein N7443_010188 [Penicillium atrosanguineum]KAJ5307759.1 hypothetical protein N7476_008415 [Penicillium atrosanguineum]
MAPIRRYLRISKHSVIECRIYLDSPSDNRWLLDSRDPVLPRVFEAIRPLVLPKLREENERLWARKKSKPVKDVIAEDEFEVAIFLRESRTRHSLLTRQKTFEQPGKKGDASTGTKPGKGLSESATDSSKPIDVEIIPDSDEEPEFDLRNIPQAEDQPKERDPSPRRKRRRVQANSPEAETKDEKKLGFLTHYESFNICGWVLCLLITRKGDRARPSAATEPKQPLMEQWISTQAQTAADED